MLTPQIIPSRRLYLSLLSVAIIFLAAILASSKSLPRIQALVSHFKTPRASSPVRQHCSVVHNAMTVPARYQTPPQPPPLFTDTPESIRAEAKQLNEKNKECLDKVVASTTPENATFASTLQHMLMDDNIRSSRERIITFYQHVSPDSALREASTDAEQELQDYGIEAMLREDVFKVVDGAYNTRQSQNLEPEQLHVLEQIRQRYVRNGLLLPPGPPKDRSKEISKRLSQLSIESQKNLNEENGSIWFTKEELEGVPSDDIDVETLEKGTGENEGKLKLTFKYTHSVPVIKYASSEATRKRYSLADANMANFNIDNFKQIIQLRDEDARILGYENHAAIKLEDKMAKKPKTVNDFLNNLRSGLSAGGVEEAQELLALKKADCKERGEPFDGNIYMWDSPYYSRLLKKKKFSVDENAISQYYPVESSFNGMLKIFEEIFGMVFVELKEADQARLSPTGKARDISWHEEVRVFSVWDDEASGGAFNGYLYIDLHPRDGKYGHNANFNIEPGYIKDSGDRHYPATALVCNFSKASAKKPALLKHREVITLFHELGHGIHDLVGRTRYSETHGTSVVRDFVEAPSQMLENWCWTPKVLKALSQHWETKETIPDDMIASLVKSKKFLPATETLNQLLIGLFDMTIHSPKTHDEAEDMEAGKLWCQMRHDISSFKGPEDQGEAIVWGHRYAGIGHFIGGYDAGYYGYLYSHVFSADMFDSFFSKNPMDGSEGRRYRKMILEKGGQMDEMEMLKAFLGREPVLEPFYKEVGLVSE